MSIICVIADAAEGAAIGAIKKPRTARTESKRAIRDHSLMISRHGTLCVAGKGGDVHIFGKTPRQGGRSFRRGFALERLLPRLHIYPEVVFIGPSENIPACCSPDSLIAHADGTVLPALARCEFDEGNGI